MGPTQNGRRAGSENLSPVTTSDKTSLALVTDGWQFRRVVVCFLALSVSLPIAWISLGKVMLFAVALALFVAGMVRRRRDEALNKLLSTQLLLLILILFALSFFWTNADQGTALMAFVKHGKLLTILLLASLIRTPRDARAALMAFAVGQLALLVGSWTLVAGLPYRYVHVYFGRGVVFSSYLDQSIIFATSAAVLWHLQPFNLWPRWLAGLFGVAALISVFLVLIGRTAYFVAIAMMALAAMWALPLKFRRVTLLGVPVITLAAFLAGPTHIQQRVSLIYSDIQNYSTKADISTSSGWRLNAWHRSVQAVAENPLTGHGVGAWTNTVKRLEGKSATAVFGPGLSSNPHQEFLLWGVELGVGGSVLLLLFLLALARDFTQFSEPVYRAGVSVVVALGVACLFNSTLYDGLIGDYFCVILGILLGLGLRAERPTASSNVGFRASPA